MALQVSHSPGSISLAMSQGVFPSSDELMQLQEPVTSAALYLLALSGIQSCWRLPGTWVAVIEGTGQWWRGHYQLLLCVHH